MSLIKRGDLQPIHLIDPVDVSDEATQQKIDELKEQMNTSQENLSSVPNSSELN